MIRLLRISAILTIVALALMVWSMLAPTPLPVMVAMTAGQAIGTLAFGLYGYAILADLRAIRRERRAKHAASEAAPPSERSESDADRRGER